MPASQPARDTIGMYVSGRRGSLEPTIDRKRQLYRKFADYYSRSQSFARINNYFSVGSSLSKDLDLYLRKRFHMGSVDRELQKTIRENLLKCKSIGRSSYGRDCRRLEESLVYLPPFRCNVTQP